MRLLKSLLIVSKFKLKISAKKILGDYFAELRKSAKEEEKRIAQENKKPIRLMLWQKKEQKLKREQSAIDFILSVGIDKGYSDEVLQTALALKSADFTDGLKRVREMFPQMTASELGKVSLEAKNLLKNRLKLLNKNQSNADTALTQPMNY